MNIVTVTDSQTGFSFQMDADLHTSMRTVDAGIGFYFSQFTNIESKIYETLYADIIFDQLVPVDTSDPEWIDNVAYISYNGATMGKFIAANGRDLPQVDIDASVSYIRVGYAGNSYGYSLEELRKAAALRMPLDAAKGRLAFRGARQHQQQVAFFGDVQRQMFGLFNHPNVPLDNSTIDWTTATGDEIVADMNALVNKVWQQSAQRHLPNTLLLPSNLWTIAQGKRMASGTDTTVLEFFMRNNTYTAVTGQPLDVRSVLYLNDAGVGGSPRMMAYEKNADNLTMRMPIPWRSLPPQPTALRLEIPCEYKMGGTEFRYPLSAAYRDVINEG
jgi:hypothetical protein